MNLNQKVQRLSDNAFEVVLGITLTCNVDDKTAYLAEVKQAGVFGLAGFDDAGIDAMLGTHCPNVLYPVRAPADQRPDPGRRLPAVLPAADQLRSAVRRKPAPARRRRSTGRPGRRRDGRQRLIRAMATDAI